MLRLKKIPYLFLLFGLLAGCFLQSTPRVSTLVRPESTAEGTSTMLPVLLPSDTPSSAAPSPAVTPSSPAPALPIPTAAAASITATVWTSDPVVPALVYHRFIPLGAANESSTKMSLQTFRAELQLLYDAGFTLVPLSAWLKGDLRVPAGRRPLILTMDDLFFADQIFLDPDGTPSERSGLGVLWKFSQAHPDFGFSAALFYNLGDKYYANKQVRDWFNVSEGWQDSLARAIAWCIEHDAMPYNHFYTHPQLVLMEPRDVTDQLKRNEVQLEKLLAQIGKADLAKRPDNLIALTYSVWPDSRGSRKTIMTYQSINGQPPLGVLEADPHLDLRYLMKAPYLAGFNPYHIPRIGSQMREIQGIVKQIDQFPKAGACTLAVDLGEAEVPDPIASAINTAVTADRCPKGVYAVQGKLFRADGQSVQPLELQHPEPR